MNIQRIFDAHIHFINQGYEYLRKGDFYSSSFKKNNLKTPHLLVAC